MKTKELFVPRTVEETVVNAMARALWVSLYASAIEEGETVGPRPGGGQDWADYAPATPVRALMHAQVFAEYVRKAAGKVCLWQVLADALGVKEFEDLMDRDKDARDFGHLTAMQSMGHGVGWADDHEPLEFKVPHTLEHVTYEDLVDDRSTVTTEGEE